MQTNVKTGELVFTAYEDLSGKENRLLVLVNDSGKAKVALPDTVNDLALFCLTDVNGGAGGPVSCLPLITDRELRVTLKGTCVPGDILILATPDGTVDGMVVKMPSTAGTYRTVGVAEEAGVDGQNVKMRPYFSLETVTA